MEDLHHEEKPPQLKIWHARPVKVINISRWLPSIYHVQEITAVVVVAIFVVNEWPEVLRQNEIANEHGKYDASSVVEPLARAINYKEEHEAQLEKIEVRISHKQHQK